MNFLTIPDIFAKLENCIEYNLPFSHIRFGDGGIKFIHALLFKDMDQLKIITKKEGLPSKMLLEIFELWGYYARRADCIDTPEVYFDGTFWPRIKSPVKLIHSETEDKMKMWRELYSCSEFDNDTYCNPESNCLMILDIPGRRTILDLMKNRKVCIITARPEIKYMLPNVDIVPIVGQYENQYENSFSKVIECINHTAKDYDFWLVAAGELGRIYSGVIKEQGGRCLDIGFVIEYWLDGFLHPRLHLFAGNSIDNNFTMRLTPEGKKYEKFI